MEEFRRRLNETYYGKKYEFGEQVQIESIVNECVEHILTIAYRNHPYSLASIQQYLFLKEEEIYKDHHGTGMYSLWIITTGDITVSGAKATTSRR